MHFGDISIALVSMDNYVDYVIRSFSIKRVCSILASHIYFVAVDGTFCPTPYKDLYLS